MSSIYSFKFCDICRDYHRKGTPCNPIFCFFDAEDFEDDNDFFWGKIRAVSFSDAAERYAEKKNSRGDYLGEFINVFISDGKTEKYFNVSVEESVVYCVCEDDISDGDKKIIEKLNIHLVGKTRENGYEDK